MTTPAMNPGMAQLQQQLVALQQKVTQMERSQRTAQMQFSSIENGALVVNDADGNAALQLGLQPDGTYAVTANTSTAPIAPSNPQAGPTALGAWVFWDGTLANGSFPLSDFQDVEVHLSVLPAFTPSSATLQGTLTKTGITVIANLAAGTAYYVTLVATNISGNSSVPASYVTVVPTATADTITPGSLPGSVLQLGTVTADLLAVGALDAQAISAVSIGASTISASQFYDGEMIGGQIQMRNSGDGVYTYAITPTQADFTPGTSPWTCPSTATVGRIQLWGDGGGGGGGAQNGNGGDAGGGGGYAENPNMTLTPNATYQVYVGNGGTGGAGSLGGGVNGTNGQGTNFSLGGVQLMAAYPGNGGWNGANSGTFSPMGTGGGGNGPINFGGGTGGSAHGTYPNGGGGGGGAGSQGNGGTGGDSNSTNAGTGGTGGQGGGGQGGLGASGGAVGRPGSNWGGGGGGGEGYTGIGTAGGNGAFGHATITTYVFELISAKNVPYATTDPLLGLSVPNGDTYFGSTSGSTTLSPSTFGQVQAATSSGVTGILPIAQTDPTVITLGSPINMTALTKSWPIPANDAQIGTVYRLTAYGSGKTSATQSVMAFTLNGIGGTWAATVNIGAVFFPNTAATNFEWFGEWIVTVNTIGISGEVAVFGRLNLGVYSGSPNNNTGGGGVNQLPGTAAQNTGGFVGGNALQSANTATAQTMTLQFGWGTSASGQQIICYGSIFERLGP